MDTKETQFMPELSWFLRHSSEKGEWVDPSPLSHCCASVFPSSPISQKPRALAHKLSFSFPYSIDLKRMSSSTLVTSNNVTNSTEQKKL